MTTQFNVFISSKMQELLAERKALQDLLPTLDSGTVKVRAWAFESDAPASNASIRAVYLDALKKSDLYVGLFWNDYGEWTVDEFDRATEWSIDRHIYVKNQDAHLRDPRLQKFLDQQSDVITGITPKWFCDSDELREQVKKSIQVWLQDRLVRHPGDASATLAESADAIPEQPAKFIGREELIAEARNFLDDSAHVLLQGFGGMGKTATAATIAANWLDDDEGPVLWLRAGSSDAGTMFEALARPFDSEGTVSSTTGSAKAKALRALLADSSVTLVVLDDVWDGAALNQVLKSIPRSIPVLVTARQRYALDEILEVGKLESREAVRLCGHHARRDYSADADAQELCRQLGYHAFALEVAGKTLKVDRIAPGELLHRIASAPHDLAMPEDFAEEGRTSITELLDASLNALDDETAKVFLAFGTLFAPSVTPELLARCMRRDEAAVNEALITLQRRGLTEQAKLADKSTSYYRIHDLAYSYARTIAAAQGYNPAVTVEAVRDYTLSHASDLEALDAELANIFGAAESARAREDHESLIQIIGSLIGLYLSARGSRLPFIQLLDAAIAAAEHMGAHYDETRHFLLSKRGNTYDDRGDPLKAIKTYQEALEIARALDMKDRQVILLGVIAKVQSDQKSPDAEASLQQAHDLAVALGDDFLLAFALEAQGYHAESSGDYEATRRIFAEGVELAERIGDPEALFYALLNLGSAEKDLGQPDAALIHHQQALEIARAHDNRIWMAHAFQSIAEDHHQLAQHQQAQDDFSQALALFRESGMKAKISEIETYMKQANYSPDPK